MFNFVVQFWDTIYQFCDKVWYYLTMPTCKALPNLFDSIGVTRFIGKWSFNIYNLIVPDALLEKAGHATSWDEAIERINSPEYTGVFLGTQPLWVTCILSLAFVSIAYYIFRWLFDLFEG